jgi:hypothetical protein
MMTFCIKIIRIPFLNYAAINNLRQCINKFKKRQRLNSSMSFKEGESNESPILITVLKLLC